MNDRERRFVELWVADPEHNGTAAARAAGYTGTDPALAVTASRLLKKAKVAAYIADLRREALERMAAERKQVWRAYRSASSSSPW